MVVAEAILTVLVVEIATLALVTTSSSSLTSSSSSSQSSSSSSTAATVVAAAAADVMVVLAGLHCAGRVERAVPFLRGPQHVLKNEVSCLCLQSRAL